MDCPTLSPPSPPSPPPPPPPDVLNELAAMRTLKSSWCALERRLRGEMGTSAREESYLLHPLKLCPQKGVHGASFKSSVMFLAKI